ncbi:MAG: ADP-ribosylglycohydrolase family protein [Victivallales bacterium]
MDNADRIGGGFFGMIVGDALGVPVEFKSREELRGNPVKGMTGYGTHNQPPGTWSDDTSMTLATIDALQGGYKPIIMLDKFCEWLFGNKYTPHGKVFDYGGATERALSHYRVNKRPCTEYDEFSNGNGSLMRILPVSLAFHKLPVEDLVQISSDVSALTHGHPRSRIACSHYSLMIKHIVEGKDFSASYSLANQEIIKYVPEAESASFARITGGKIADFVEKDIKSDGYVIHTLEAALWCCLTTDSFRNAVLKAVNLGNDTDTVGAVAGGLAGAFYGIKEIPEEWVSDLAKIEDLWRFSKKLIRAESDAPYHYKLIKSVKANTGDKIAGLGVKKIMVAHSNVGGVSQYDYMKLMGKPADLNEVLDFFNGMMFHCATITLEKGWTLNINAYEGFRGLEKKNSKNCAAAQES